MTVKKKTAKKRVVKKKRAAKKPLKKFHLPNGRWDKVKVMEHLCLVMATTSYGLAYLCKKESDLPGVRTVLTWLNDEEVKGGNGPLIGIYTRGKSFQSDYMVDEMLEISDDGSNDFYELEGIEKPNSENIQRSRLRVDARKWIASKLKPKKYGDKLELSGDPERPLRDLSHEELDSKIVALSKQLEQLTL